MVNTLNLGPGLGSMARQYWWLLLVRGIVAILFGVMALAWPAITVLALVTVFAVYAFLDGIAAIGMGLSERRAGHRWGYSVFNGVVSILAGITAVVWPAMTAVVLLLVIALWALVAGVMSIMGSLALRRAGMKQWIWTMIFGVCAVLFGISLVVNPGRGILSVLWVIAVFAIAGGISLCIASFTVRKIGQDSPRQVA